MALYLRILAILYAIGAFLHVLDLFDLRLRFSSMSEVWKAWIVYLTLADSITAIGLWKGKLWGIALFLVIALSQLVAYMGFTSVFGEQYSLVAFHIATIAMFFGLRFKGQRR